MRQQLLSYNEALGRYEIPSSSPLWGLLGVRGVIGLHSEPERLALERHARGKRVAVEIGVAEGASARTLKSALGPGAVLTLIDPHPPGRVRGVNPRWLIARIHVGTASGARVNWIRDVSFSAVRGWTQAIDFLFIDADHAYESCKRDFLDWSPFVVDGGLVALHDARVFPGSWTNQQSGPVRVVNELFRQNPQPGWAIVDEVDSLVVVQRQTASGGTPGRRPGS